LAEIETDVHTEKIPRTPADEGVRICLFSISGDGYAVTVDTVVEIIIPQKIFPVPTAPPHVLGVINLRGNIVPVVDIRPVLSLPPSDGINQIAVIRQNQIMIGIAVDSVSEVIEVPQASVLPLPAEVAAQESGAKSRSRYLRALIQRADSVAALLNLERVLESISLS
jgi:purine-binding chemotaxis protein CheW